MKYYLATPIYYVNAEPHIGHTYTTLLADVIARYKRLEGRDVYFLTGTDEHGTKIARKAKENQKQPQEFCDQITQKFKKTWQNYNFGHDQFIRTTSSKHISGAQKLFSALKDKGDLYQKEYQGLYCTGCESFKTEKELDQKGLCPDHKKKPGLVKEKNYFFKLSKYLKPLKQAIEKDQLIIQPVERKNEVLGLFEQGINDFSVSRSSQNVNWGIDVPFDKKQKIYVWVEALMNYITALDYGKAGAEANLFKKYWPVDVHFMAKEIIKFHAIFFPAILMSLRMKVCKKIFVHGYFTINGEKMSKSLGNVIEPNSLIKTWGVDPARYLLLSQFASDSDGDISLKKLKQDYDHKLADNLGNLLQRTLVMINKNGFDFKLKQVNPFKKPQAYDFRDFDLPLFLKLLDNIQVYQAIKQLDGFISKSNQYLEINKPWELANKNPAKCREILKQIFDRLTLIARLFEPVMPQISAKMIKQLENKQPQVIFKKI
ncbi:MAG: methionine--tRNA ligase [Candidatus Moranbacteria bacterium]|nr:methionine--tRNA ligase [Candidatus Moranbacteria bacterium]